MAIIIKTTIKHHLQCCYRQDFLQATNISMEDSTEPLTISDVHLPPKFTVKQEHLDEFYNTLRQRFIAEVAKYSKQWGKNNLSHLSTSEPTYWPSD
jgi:hypothetical protein